ncbi:MAG: hypothetical protein GX539_01555 [Candidatus Cloacimonetes bacterium]|nr:hypothetical protein [Candidatus Cloacimonadota bacterium]
MDMDVSAITGDAPVLDIRALERVQRIGGLQLVQRMIRAFLEHVPARVDALLASASALDAARAAHAIKSSAGNLGLERLRLIVREIEARAELGDETWSELRMYVAGEIDAARPVLEVHLERSE